MIGVIVGMRSEAKLVPGHRVVCSGGDPRRAHALAERLLTEGAEGLLSLGIAGALAPELHPGDLVVASAVETEAGVLPVDPTWFEGLRWRLPEALAGIVYGAAEAAATPPQKSRLHAGAGGLAVDLESGPVAQVCAEAGRPFAVLRTIADPAHRSIPPLALTALDPEGRPRVGRVVMGLLSRPGDLPGLVQVGLDTKAALRSLADAVRRLGPALGFQPG